MQVYDFFVHIVWLLENKIKYIDNWIEYANQQIDTNHVPTHWKNLAINWYHVCKGSFRFHIYYSCMIL